MILTDKQILLEIEKKNIVIAPFDRKNLGTNSYDVHLSKHFACYEDDILDAKKHNKIRHFELPEEGFILKPGVLYLATTLEYTETHKHVPFLEGKSSMGRLGVDIHATAGKGDVGYCNYWTLEISCIQPVKIYPFMPVGQIIYFATEGTIENFYNTKYNVKYNEKTERPVESMMWKNIF